MLALAWQDDDVGSELLLMNEAHMTSSSSPRGRLYTQWLRYRSVLTSLPDQVSPNARHWCCKTLPLMQWLDLHACKHRQSPYEWNCRSNQHWICHILADRLNMYVFSWPLFTSSSSIWMNQRYQWPSAVMVWPKLCHRSMNSVILRLSHNDHMQFSTPQWLCANQSKTS